MSDIDCPFCNGEGIRNPINGSVCPICEGKTTVFVDYHSWAADEICSTCNGTGIIDNPVQCIACNGTGIVAGS